MSPDYYLLHYDTDGEVINFWNPLRGECPYSPTIEVSKEEHDEVFAAPYLHRVVDGKLKKREEQVKEKRKVHTVEDSIIAGLVIGGSCFALEPRALTLPQLDLQSKRERIRFVTITGDGQKIRDFSRSSAEGVLEKLADRLAEVYSV